MEEKTQIVSQELLVTGSHLKPEIFYSTDLAYLYGQRLYFFYLLDADNFQSINFSISAHSSQQDKARADEDSSNGFRICIFSHSIFRFLGHGLVNETDHAKWSKRRLQMNPAFNRG